MSEEDTKAWSVRMREPEEPLWSSHLRQPPTWIEFMREIDAQWRRFMREQDSPEQRLKTKIQQRFSFDR